MKVTKINLAEENYTVPRDCYNSYFFAVEDPKVNVLDKLILHGEQLIKYLDGGSALHLNLDEYLTKDGFKKLINAAAKTGANYMTTNVKITICNKCGKIDKHTLNKCPECGSEDIDHATRVIGYLKRVSSFSSARQKEHDVRNYHTSCSC